jgi:glycosyltransferase involved in cell wall biosynthesis
MLSILIPFKNDFGEIEPVVKHLLDTAGTDDLEIIVYNDGSFYGDNKPRALELDFPHTRVINASQSFGVGFAFDRLVEAAQSENIVLMGDDVFPHEGWYPKVLQAINAKPESIGCSVCVGNLKPFRKHYGADMLITMDNDDLPLGSKLRERAGGYTDIFRGRWADEKGIEPYEISCLMGAFYFTTKSWYQTIGGFDTQPRNRYCGHRVWSHLEPHLSLKSYLSGGNCVLYPDIEATHIFNRIDKMHRGAKGGRSAEWFHWNSQWILETMVLNDLARNMIKDFMHRELNWNVAEQMIKRNRATVDRYKEMNRQRFKISFREYMDRFGLIIKAG